MLFFEVFNIASLYLSNELIGVISLQIEEGNNVQENRLLLQSLTSYIVKQNRCEICVKYIFSPLKIHMLYL